MFLPAATQAGEHEDMSEWSTPEETNLRPAQRSLVADLMSFGPASTPGREVIVAGLQIGLVLLLVFVVFPDRFGGSLLLIVLAVTVVYWILRIAAGIPQWRSRR